MKLYLDCSMGASGDMLMAALYELVNDKKAFREKMKRLGLPGVTLEYSPSVKCGIRGTRITVKVGGAEELSEDVHIRDDSLEHGEEHAHAHPHSDAGHTHSDTDHAHSHEHDHKHSHTESKTANSAGHSSGGIEELLDIVRGLELPENVLEDVLSVYSLIGNAEASVHGVAPDKIHLHEIGTLDAAADITGCCILMNMLGVSEAAASPVHVGSGFVRCAHGVLPVPAPATAEILKGIPFYGGRIEGELCTPTGAALLKHFVKKFGESEPITVKKIGYGMGHKDFEAANCLRAYLCDSDSPGYGEMEEVFEISCNLDDMTPEAVGAAMGILFENGALDVYTTPIMMKKNRSAVVLTCLSAAVDRDKLVKGMLEHTTTLGVRVSSCRRVVMQRYTETVPTEYGEIRVKFARGPVGYKCKPEYDDVLAAAKAHNVPFLTVFDAAQRKARP